MNKARRKLVAYAISHLCDAEEMLLDVRDQESAALHMMPKHLQDSKRARAMETATDITDDAITCINGLIGELKKIK
jgi:hypothetical protein